MNWKLLVFDEERGKQKITRKPGIKPHDIPAAYQYPACKASNTCAGRA